MKTCPVCHLESQEDYQYCPEDGSSLSAQEPQVGAIAIQQVDETPLDSRPLDEATAAAVLYCPACANVYPLTFTNCPAHGVQLTTRRVEVSAGRPPNRETRLVTHNALPPEEPEPVADHPVRALVQTFNDNPNTPDDECDRGAIPSNSPRVTSRVGSAIASAAWLQPFKSAGASASEPGSRPTNRSHRIAAVGLIIGLGVFAVIAFSVILAGYSRRQSHKGVIQTAIAPRNPPVLKRDDPPAPFPYQRDDTPPVTGKITLPTRKPPDSPRRAGIAVSRFGASVIQKGKALGLVFNISLKRFTERKPHIISVSMKPRLAKGKRNALKLPFPTALRFDPKGNTQWKSAVTIPAFKEIDWGGGAKIVVLYYSYDSSDIQEASFTTTVTFQSRASHGRRADGGSSDTRCRRRGGASLSPSQVAD